MHFDAYSESMEYTALVGQDECGIGREERLGEREDVGGTSYMKKTEQLPPRSLHYPEEYVNFNSYTNVDGRVPIQFFPCMRWWLRCGDRMRW